jgi:predicted TIM-barrel fold metal-dependent hydrolase
MRITHLPAVTELVRQCPDVTFILERLGKPAIKYHQLDPWREQLAALAIFPNVAFDTPLAKAEGMLPTQPAQPVEKG